MTQSTEQERQEFEAWAKNYGTWEVKRDDTPKYGIESYYDVVVLIAWHAWQAARRAPAVPVPDVTDAMREAAEEAYMPFGDMGLAIQCALAAAPQPPEAAPVPQFSRIAQKKLAYLLEAGESITGYAIENKDGRRGAIDCHGFVYWWQDAAAPQPPEAAQSNSAEFDGIKTKAAPVQMPEPVAIITDTVPREPGWKTMFVPDSGTRLYTEHQVRQLLSAREQST